VIRAEPIPLDKHFSPRFYAELWGVDVSTVVRWFRDHPGVLKVGNPRGGKRTRCELRIPLSVALQVYSERTR
jgi:hypothetical protein